MKYFKKKFLPFKFVVLTPSRNILQDGAEEVHLINNQCLSLETNPMCYYLYYALTNTFKTKMTALFGAIRILDNASFMFTWNL